MSKQRREKAKAKQRRHNEINVVKKEPAATAAATAAVAVQSIVKPVKSSNVLLNSTKVTKSSAPVKSNSASPVAATKKPITLPLIVTANINAKHLEHATPLWKTFYGAVSSSTN